MSDLLRKLAACVLAFALPFSAQAASEPQAVVEAVTKQLMGIAREHGGSGGNQEVYFSEVEKILGDVVDFRFIARNVMGKDSFNKATPAQRQKFTEVFRGGLVKSYAKGIAGYVNSEIKVVGASVNPNDPSRAVVRQEVSHEGAVHQLSYSMRLQDEQWQVINVILNGVNLGQSFSSQFTAAMRKESGDLDKVINNWLAES
jgi:phospholipid transport system substrate-binding protein